MKRSLLLISFSTLLTIHSPALFADDQSRPDAHAPIGVMYEHAHHKGEFMFSYRYMSMEMDGNRDGTNELSNSEVLADFIVTPLDMTMEMHMLGLMYAPSDTVTLMLGVPVIETSMDHLVRNGNTFTTESGGLGDVKVGAIFTLDKTEASNLLASIALSLPTGSIDEEDIIPAVSMTEDTQLPFPMQIGSGTYDLLPSITYTRALVGRSWGAQLSTVIRLDENDNGYTLGNREQAQAWHSWLVNKNVSLSSRLSFEKWGSINGDDDTRMLPTTNPMGVGTVTTVDPSNHGGERANLGLGVNTIFGKQEHRFAFEAVVPVYQNLNGPQLQSDLGLTLGYQKAF